MNPPLRHALVETWAVARSGPSRSLLGLGLIAIALYVPALGVLLARNLARLLGEPGESPTLVLTLSASADAGGIAREVAQDPRVRQVRVVGPEAARARLLRAYPDLAPALGQLPAAPFPPTVEVMVEPGAPAGVVEDLSTVARRLPGVEDVDSDAAFEGRFRRALALARSAMLTLGAILIAAAVFSIASAVRLALDHHRDEVEIMRLMGATELAIRSPFWLYGALAGLAGGLAALTLLYGSFRAAGWALSREPHLLLSVFWADFLAPWQAAAVPGAGTVAGFLGAVISVGRAKV